MGQGDEILATGEARKLYRSDPRHRPVAILDRNGKPRWHGLWQGNPCVATPGAVAAGADVQRITNGPGCRPYIDYARMAREFAAVHPSRPFRTKIRDARLPYRFTKHRCARGELRFFERLPPGGYVVIEPHTKPSQVNRDWGWARWQAVVSAVKADWIQINPQGVRILAGVRHRPAASFEAACRLLLGAALYVGPEGGLYHAAAALGVPAVAIFGGWVSPANQGYDDMINLYEPMEGESPCGQRVPCAHCRDALGRISPETVVAYVKQALDTAA